jgi:hypothetical protein
VGKNLEDWAPEIAAPRLDAINAAIDSPLGQARYSYSHEWEGLTWRFNCLVQCADPFPEVVVTIYDAEPWQAEWWDAL